MTGYLASVLIICIICLLVLLVNSHKRVKELEYRIDFMLNKSHKRNSTPKTYSKEPETN